MASIFDVKYEKHFRRQLTPESCPEERTGRPEIRAYAHQREMTGRPLWAELGPARAAPGYSVLNREQHVGRGRDRGRGVVEGSAHLTRSPVRWVPTGWDSRRHAHTWAVLSNCT